MKIVGFRELLPATDPNALLDLEAPAPVATGHDILVRVKAVSVNPVDTKVRSRASNSASVGDASGSQYVRASMPTAFSDMARRRLGKKVRVR